MRKCSPRDHASFDPGRSVCRNWQAGNECTAPFKQTKGKKEWHATLFHPLLGKTAGDDVRLKAVLRVKREGGHASETLCGGNPFDCDSATLLGDFELINHVSVHLGENSLPRFGDTGPTEISTTIRKGRRMRERPVMRTAEPPMPWLPWDCSLPTQRNTGPTASN